MHLLISLEDLGDKTADELEVLALVEVEKPLRALDLCYRDEPNTFSILTDGLASAVTLAAYAPESRRAHQMMTVITAIIPHYLKYPLYLPASASYLYLDRAGLKARGRGVWGKVRGARARVR